MTRPLFRRHRTAGMSCGIAKYRGKISVWDDLSTVYMAAQVLGYDKPDPGAALQPER